MEIKTGKQIEFERLEHSIVQDDKGNLIQDKNIKKKHDDKKWVSLEILKDFLRRNKVCLDRQRTWTEAFEYIEKEITKE
jgi:hypothetical protein